MNLWKYVAEVLFPTRCLRCNRSGSALCEHCAGQLVFSGNTEHPWSMAVYEYGDPLVEKIIHQCKYYRKSAPFESLVCYALPHLGVMLAERLMSDAVSTLIVVPIPLSSSHKGRGFNQSELGARIIANAFSGTMQRALRSVRTTVPQALLKKKTDRLKNMQGTMRTAHYIDPSKIYIVFDDVTTTGATFIEARRALRDGGAKQILCIALAHGYSRKHNLLAHAKIPR